MAKKWTNSSLRQRLGEAGYIKTDIVPVGDKHDHVGSVWERGGSLVTLWEHVINQPKLTDYRTHNPVDPETLGVRNVNTQNPDTLRP